jgi:hypothetical protein
VIWYIGYDHDRRRCWVFVAPRLVGQPRTARRRRRLPPPRIGLRLASLSVVVTRCAAWVPGLVGSAWWLGTRRLRVEAPDSSVPHPAPAVESRAAARLCTDRVSRPSACVSDLRAAGIPGVRGRSDRPGRWCLVAGVGRPGLRLLPWLPACVGHLVVGVRSVDGGLDCAGRLATSTGRQFETRARDHRQRWPGRGLGETGLLASGTATWPGVNQLLRYGIWWSRERQSLERGRRRVVHG